MELAQFSESFWDCDPSKLDWNSHKDFIIKRLLQTGNIQSLHWLKQKLGARGLRAWIIRNQAAGLSPRQIRFWSLILSIPTRLADRWVAAAKETIWEKRDTL